ncbi:MAG: 50S ribosomal protein L4 [Nanoarchaeota archaeon]
MKTTLYDINGKEKSKVDLPSCFSERIREDIVSKVLEARKIKQPYSPSLVGGKQHSASGKIRHRRHVWQTHYGKGMSRIPRKVMSRRGTQFNWVGAEVSGTRGGRRSHPPKVVSMINTLKINKKEFLIALKSAISATADKKFMHKKYKTINKEINVPIVIETKSTVLKTKSFLSLMKNIFGEDIFKILIRKRSQRQGKGKMRGRKYKVNAGLLIVVGEKEHMKIKNFDVENVKNLSIDSLASGGLGRITIYTENAIKHLENLK